MIFDCYIYVQQTSTTNFGARVLIYGTIRVPPAGYPLRTGTRQIIEVGLGLATG